MEFEYAFEMSASNIRFGPGVTREVGMDLAEMNAQRVMVVTDPTLAKLAPVATVVESLKREKIQFELYDRVHVEPTDVSMNEAIAYSREGRFDAYVAVGGGSTMDTAKVANLYSTYPADFLDYVNAPIGKGKPVPGPLKPLFAVPTTAGTGSETTGVAIFDLLEMRAKTGIAHRYLKPTLGLIDPENTKTMPAMVATSTGFDVLVHALESFTTMPYDRRDRPARPILRPAYQGRNMISDLWSSEAIRVAAKFLPRAVENPDDSEARARMILAASYAGVGFGNAGLHLPHGMSYPVSGMARDYRPAGYPSKEPMIPHGISVVLNAPAAFRFTGPGCPERHLQAAEFLGADVSGVKPVNAGDILADQLIKLMQRLHVPNGLSAVGYTHEDIPALVEGTLPQHRVIKLSPRPAGREEFAQLFEKSMIIW
ncbi:MAG: iron-containing alcohol dehydrogenase [Acidobacteria bacterium]|nr:iron-containing alcohol dehydrogenase [Acidobacteriota bacterium]